MSADELPPNATKAEKIAWVNRQKMHRRIGEPSTLAEYQAETLIYATWGAKVPKGVESGDLG